MPNDPTRSKFVNQNVHGAQMCSDVLWGSGHAQCSQRGAAELKNTARETTNCRTDA